MRWRRVQDGVATRGIFAGPCHSGLRARRTHHAVVGGLGASLVSFGLVSTLCGAVGCVSIYALPSKLLLCALRRIPDPYDGLPAGVISYRFAR